MSVNTGTPEKSSSYRSILKSTMLIGGSSAINMIIGMVRTKFVAILIGPSGVGLMGTFSQVTNLVYTISSLGLGRSGVRQIAESFATNDEERISRTVVTLRRSVWLTGCLGMLALILFSYPISKITFDDSQYVVSLAFLGVIILLTSIAAGQACILQGTRRISALAKVSVISAVAGTVFSIPCFYFWGKGGIVPSLILTGVGSVATSWWFTRKIELKKISLPWQSGWGELRQMMSLGIGLMAASLTTNASTYLIQTFIIRRFGLAGAGVCQAALSLSLVFVGFVLGSMGADYYPRLTAVAEDDTAMRRMVNEQLGISISLALPGLALMLVFSPLIIHLFYSSSFVAAIPILRWCCLGMFGRVLSWPLGYLVMAKGYGRLYFLTELVSALSQVAGVFVLTRFFGLNGVGMALVAQNVLYTLFMIYVMKRVVGAAWSKEIVVKSLASVALLSALMINVEFNINTVSRHVASGAILILIVCLCGHHVYRNSRIGDRFSAANAPVRS
jgi:enterobacterial common antigen flippase